MREKYHSSEISSNERTAKFVSKLLDDRMFDIEISIEIVDADRLPLEEAELLVNELKRRGLLVTSGYNYILAMPEEDRLHPYLGRRIFASGNARSFSY